MKRITKSKILSAVIWAAQLLAGVLLLHKIRAVNLLPGKFLVIPYLLLFLLAVVTGALLFLPRKKPGRARSIVAAVVALIAVLACLVGYSAVSKLSTTMVRISRGQAAGINATIGVYVLEDDPAQTIADAGDYTFAASDTESFFISQAIEQISAEVGRDIEARSFDNVIGALDALYGQQAQALILDKAFVDVLEGTEIYGSFSERTRLLYEIPVSRVRDTGAQEASDDANTPDRQRGEITEEPFVLYLSGLDTRDRLLSTSRSDVNILAVVNPRTKQILLVNTPRDYYVANPAGGGAYDKLTHCGIYGIDCSMEALGNLYGTHVDYYAQINFTGFETLIDAIGGVSVYSDTSFVAGGVYPIQEGENYLDGSAALAFSRERHALSGGDNDRGRNQMRVIQAVVRKLSSGTILTNYSDVLDSLGGMLITDISADDMAKLVKMQLSDMAKWDVLTYAVRGYGGSDYTYSFSGQMLYVMYPMEETVSHATSLIQSVLDGRTLSADDLAD